MAEIQLKEIMVGDECEAARSNLEINYPIDNGKVTDWGDMCKLWDHAFYDQLKVREAHTSLVEDSVEGERERGASSLSPCLQCPMSDPCRPPPPSWWSAL